MFPEHSLKYYKNAVFYRIFQKFCKYWCKMTQSPSFITNNNLNFYWWSRVHFFSSKVWPAILITLLLSGPVLFIFVASANYNQHIHRNKTKVFADCVWITCTIFFQQGEYFPFFVFIFRILFLKRCIYEFSAIRFRPNNQKVRFVIILLSLSLTYVIGDMYSANLTSLFARPSKGF